MRQAQCCLRGLETRRGLTGLLRLAQKDGLGKLRGGTWLSQEEKGRGTVPGLLFVSEGVKMGTSIKEFPLPVLPPPAPAPYKVYFIRSVRAAGKDM